jgi:hypothetical protein
MEQELLISKVVRSSVCLFDEGADAHNEIGGTSSGFSLDSDGSKGGLG